MSITTGADSRADSIVETAINSPARSEVALSGDAADNKTPEKQLAAKVCF